MPKVLAFRYSDQDVVTFATRPSMMTAAHASRKRCMRCLHEIDSACKLGSPEPSALSSCSIISDARLPSSRSPYRSTRAVLGGSAPRAICAFEMICCALLTMAPLVASSPQSARITRPITVAPGWHTSSICCTVGQLGGAMVLSESRCVNSCPARCRMLRSRAALRISSAFPVSPKCRASSHAIASRTPASWSTMSMKKMTSGSRVASVSNALRSSLSHSSRDSGA